MSFPIFTEQLQMAGVMLCALHSLFSPQKIYMMATTNIPILEVG